jgi:deoxynucleoside triphosphate triphosphohydrolase SAMHD1
MAWEPIALIEADNISFFLQGMDEFCAGFLPKDPPLHPERKIIADPVEGYCSLAAWEVCIVDTPLFQRLRGIRQLGLAYLVYPTLGYSRFEHVLGVRSRLDQLITTLKNNQAHRDEREEGRTAALPNDRQLDKQLQKMRLAVLCHDLGHCLFSHVSEAIITHLSGGPEYPSGSAIRGAFKKWAGREIPMSEILSITILTSPSFIRYLQKTGIPGGSTIEGAERIALDAGHLVAGLPIPGDKTSLFLAQLLSGGIDIDKLDYMFRESLLSGISLGISLDWLMKKLFVDQLPGTALPSGLRDRIHNFSSSENFAVLSLERGGQFAFEEFCIARLALHEKIYLHQKIRSAEVQTKAILETIVVAHPEYNRVHRWLYLKESIVDQPTAALPIQYPLLERGEGNVASWQPIEHRLLPVRAYAFGWQNSINETLVIDPYSDPNRSNVEQLINLARNNPEVVEKEILEQLKEIASLLKLDVKVLTPSPRIFIDPPKLSTIQQGVDTIHFQYPPRLSPHWTMPIDQIEKYYYRNRALGYVFATCSNVACVLLAAEMAAYKLTKTVCIQEGLIGNKIWQDAESLRKKLEVQGFYKATAALRPMPQDLVSVAAQDIVREIAAKLSSYESKSLCRITPASVTTYIAQFESSLQDAALKWLRHIDFVRPEKGIKAEINRIVRDNATKYRVIGVSPLGATTDSATHLGYSLRDPIEDPLRKMVVAQVLPLTEALACESDAYILYDDNVNSGHQAVNIFAGLLEKTLPSDLTLKEDHVQPLDSKQRKEILSKPLFLVYDVATQGACSHLKELLVKHCGLDAGLVTCISHRELKDSEKIFSGHAFQHDEKMRLRDYLIDVASSIFISEGRDPEVARDRALGDNNAEGMIVFPYNCPTMTVPALWLTGSYQGVEWVPLAERNRRRRPGSGTVVGEDA